MSICICLCRLAAVHSQPRRARAKTIMIPMIYLGLAAVADKHTVHWDSTWTHSLLRGPAVETMEGGASVHVLPSDINGSCRPPSRLRGTVRPLTQTTMLHEVFRIPPERKGRPYTFQRHAARGCPHGRFVIQIIRRGTIGY